MWGCQNLCEWGEFMGVTKMCWTFERCVLDKRFRNGQNWWGLIQICDGAKICGVAKICKVGKIKTVELEKRWYYSLFYFFLYFVFSFFYCFAFLCSCLVAIFFFLNICGFFLLFICGLFVAHFVLISYFYHADFLLAVFLLIRCFFVTQRFYIACLRYSRFSDSFSYISLFFFTIVQYSSGSLPFIRPALFHYNSSTFLSYGYPLSIFFLPFFTPFYLRTHFISSSSLLHFSAYYNSFFLIIIPFPPRFLGTRNAV